MADGNKTTIKDTTKDQAPVDDRNSAVGFTRDDLTPDVETSVEAAQRRKMSAKDLQRAQHVFTATDMRDQKISKLEPHIFANEERESRFGRKR